MAAVPSIDSLPYEVRQEIYSLIVRQTDSHARNSGSVPTLARYATVSKRWQEEFVEPLIFKELRVTPNRLQDFNHIVSSPRRRGLVQTILFHVSLDRYEQYLDSEQETSAERRRSVEILVTALKDIFRAMILWKKSETSPRGLDLHLVIDSPSDSSTLVGGKRGLLVTARGLTSYLKIDPDTLSLPYLDVFSGFRCTGRHLKPTSALAIASRLRTLEYLDLELSHDSTRTRDIEQRNNFANGLEEHAETVRVLSLHRPSPMLTASPSPPKQPWSDFYVKMRAFSQQCESFDFDDCIDAMQFFAPFLPGHTAERTLRGQEAPLWMRLKRLNVRNSYLVKAPYLRVASRAEALASIHKILVAVGRATSRMPGLLFARVSQYILTDGELEWFVIIYECHAGKAVVRVRGFVPSKPILGAWRHSVTTKELEFDVVHENDGANVPEL
ncbi:uncharacterized protein GGS22DRAFT_169951 [Annulohypoxylon maeteangense]|uniref:uncharacterized protein n=1 Tax=Annulohypoxylon maeteangense TaxID=1927788 RepID=UPI002007B3F5|nr:uncharacterized protein GGS22DRAFT_169951 [Annulohypoxylon maeteangense]KAI0882639.1 hypothetical protein GGS22DRAFT_169951 [Annulohypoxylon maeteangense]